MTSFHYPSTRPVFTGNGNRSPVNSGSGNRALHRQYFIMIQLCVVLLTDDQLALSCLLRAEGHTLFIPVLFDGGVRTAENRNSVRIRI